MTDDNTGLPGPDRSIEVGQPEPLTAPWSAPPEDVTTPVPVSPVDRPDALGKPPSRSGLRWGIALLVSILVVGIAAGAFYFVSGSTATSPLLADAPSDSLYYAELRPDLPGGQQQAVGDFLSAFPGFADRSQLEVKLSETFDRLIGRASNDKYDYSTQIKPWFGGQIGLVQPNLPIVSGTNHFLGLVLVTDATKATDWIKSILAGTTTTTESYGGVTLTEGTRDQMTGAFGVKGEILLVGDLDSVKAGIDAESKGSLRDNDQLRSAAAALPGDHLAFVYVDNKGLLAWTRGQTALGGQSGQLLADIQQCLSGDPSWTAVAVRADGSALVAESATPKETVVVARDSILSRLAPHLPASTVVALDTNELGKFALGTLDHCRSFPSIGTALKQIDPQVNALGGYAAYLGWIGDAGVVVTQENGTAYGGLVIVPADKTGADRVVVQIKNLLALSGGAGIKVSDEPYAGTTITTITVPGQVAGLPSAIDGAVFAVRDDVVVIGVQAAFVKAVLDTKPENSLASVDRYKQLVGRATDKNFGQLYIDLTAVREMIEKVAPSGSLGAYERDYKPYLVPFDAIAGSTWTDGGLIRGRFIIGTNK